MKIPNKKEPSQSDKEWYQSGYVQAIKDIGDEIKEVHMDMKKRSEFPKLYTAGFARSINIVIRTGDSYLKFVQEENKKGK